MYRRFVQRRNRFWIRSVLFSVIHLLVSGSILYCYAIQDVDLTPWLSVDASEFVRTVALYAFYCINLPVWVADHYMPGGGSTRFVLVIAMSIIDSILYGPALAGVLWLAGRDFGNRPPRLGLTGRIVGRGLIFAIGYFALSPLLAFTILADSQGLLPSNFAWLGEIDAVLQIMHPLATLLDLDFQKDVLPYTIVMMLDSAIIGVMFAWGWHWLLPTHGSPQHKASLRR